MESLLGPAIYQYLISSDQWKKGYKTFHKVLRKPLGWFFYEDNENTQFRRLNRKECCNVYTEVSAKNQTCPRCIKATVHETLKKTHGADIRYFKCYKNRTCALVTFNVYEKRGAIVFCNLKDLSKAGNEKLQCFVPFLRSELDSFTKMRDLQNVYETVHPRALALSSLHSVNRVISSSLKLDDLIPKIGRLCAQILKSAYCAILLMDEERKWLIPHFLMDPTGQDKNRKRFQVGKGVAGHVAESGEFRVTRSCIALPLIDDDVIGVIVIKNKLDRRPYTRSDVEVLKALCEQAVVAIRNAQLLEEHERITLGSIKSINNILDINLPRERTYTHVFTALVYELARRLEFNQQDMLNVQRAASLLDAGHLGIPESILEKKGKLTKREYEIIKTHPYRGVEILKSINSLKPVIPIILYHHERYDGKGYPEGLRGSEIPLGARLISLIVAFMAMITKRPYRETKTIEQALEEIEHLAGAQFDPKMVKEFLRMMQEDAIKKLVKGE